MRHSTVRLTKTFLFALFLITAAIAQPSAASCPDLVPLTIDSPDLLFSDSSSPVLERRLDVPTAGVLILEARDLNTPDQVVWIDIQPVRCKTMGQRSALRSIDRSIDRRIVEVTAGTYRVRTGWVDPLREGQALEVRGQFFASRPSGLNNLLTLDGEEENDDGNGTSEADNEILPLAPIHLVTLDGEEENDDGNGTSEADNEILPLAPIHLVTLDGEEENDDGNGTSEADNEILPLAPIGLSGTGLGSQTASEVVSVVRPGSSERWAFRLETPSLVRLIAVGDGPSVWTLADESGFQFAVGDFDWSGDQDRLLALSSGSYVLTISSSDDRSGSYGLRLNQRPLK